MMMLLGCLGCRVTADKETLHCTMYQHPTYFPALPKCLRYVRLLISLLRREGKTSVYVDLSYKLLNWTYPICNF